MFNCEGFLEFKDKKNGKDIEYAACVKLKKQAFEKGTENVKEGTGDPWFTLNMKSLDSSMLAEFLDFSRGEEYGVVVYRKDEYEGEVFNQESVGLYKKYEVKKSDGSQADGNYFVLNLNEPAARDAAIFYGLITGNEKLVEDLRI